jgi:hypothetical protein
MAGTFVVSTSKALLAGDGRRWWAYHPLVEVRHAATALGRRLVGHLALVQLRDLGLLGLNRGVELLEVRRYVVLHVVLQLPPQNVLVAAEPAGHAGERALVAQMGRYVLPLQPARVAVVGARLGHLAARRQVVLHRVGPHHGPAALGARQEVVVGDLGVRLGPDHTTSGHRGGGPLE